MLDFLITIFLNVNLNTDIPRKYFVQTFVCVILSTGSFIGFTKCQHLSTSFKFVFLDVTFINDIVQLICVQYLNNGYYSCLCDKSAIYSINPAIFIVNIS
jgi:hypothetical protein